MKKGIPLDRNRQQIKGVFVFQDDEDVKKYATPLTKVLDCTVTSQTGNRVVVVTSRGNLTSIKTRWQNKQASDNLPQDFFERIAQIVIGGNI